MNQLKDINEKARQIVSVCQEEKAIYKHEIFKQVREKYHVRIEDGDECLMLIPKKEFYPKENPEGYPFDVFEFQDDQPKDKNLRKIPAIVDKIQSKMIQRIKMRCNLKDIDLDEFSTSFTVDDYLMFEGALWTENWEHFTIKTMKPILKSKKD